MLLKFITTIFNCCLAPYYPMKCGFFIIGGKPFLARREGQKYRNRGLNYSLNTDVCPNADDIDWAARRVIGWVGNPLVVQGNKQLFIGLDAVIGL
jgi:hypothetical protein